MAIYVSGDIVPVHDTSGVTAWAAGNNMQKGVWTNVLDFGPTSDGSSSISQAVNTGEWYNCQIIIVHNDDNVYHEVEWWIASGDHYGASASQISRTGDVSRIKDPTCSTSSAVKTITFSASSISNGSSLRAYMLRLQ